MKSPLQKAVDDVGGPAAAARLLRITPGFVWQWLNDRRPIPPKHCAAMEAATGIPCEELRPDVDWERDASGHVVGYLVRLGRCGTRTDGEG